MENCLVTKLKGVVNNDNLPYLGSMAIRINTVGASSNMQIGITVGSKQTIKTKRGSSFIVDSQSYTSYTIPANVQVTLAFATGVDDVLYITDKYSVNFLAYTENKGNAGFSIEDLNFSSKLNCLYLHYATLEGDFKPINPASIAHFQTSPGEYNNPKDTSTLDLSVLSEAVNMQTLVKKTNVSGSIESLSKCIKLFQLHLPNNSKVVGSVEALASAQVAEPNSRTSGVLTLQLLNTGCTLNGNPITSDYINIRFGSSMENPTAEETAQGWQIV